MTKRDVECQVHTWMMKKVTKVIVYKMKEEKRKRGLEKLFENHSTRACPRILFAKTTPVALPPLRKNPISWPKTQTSFRSCTL